MGIIRAIASHSMAQKMNCAWLSNPPLSMFAVASSLFRMFPYQLETQRVVDVCGGSRFPEVCDHPATPKTFSFCLYALVYDPRSHNMPVCVLRNGNFRETLGPSLIFPQLGCTYTLWCVYLRHLLERPCGNGPLPCRAASVLCSVR